VNRIDQTTNGNMRALAKMIKLWKREQNVHIKSFVMELLLAKWLESYPNGIHDYYWYDFFIRDFLRFMIGKAHSFVIVPGTNDIIWLGDTWKAKAEAALEIGHLQERRS